jgi:hypothetical protein
MTAESLLDEMEALLETERASLRALDASRVVEIAERKSEIVAALATAAPSRKDLRPRIEAMIRMLRENCLLLAHARHCVRDVTGGVARELNRRGGAPAAEGDGAPRKGLRVSLRG